MTVPNFPVNPVIGDVFISQNSAVYQWNGVQWDYLRGAPAGVLHKLIDTDILNPQVGQGIFFNGVRWENSANAFAAGVGTGLAATGTTQGTGLVLVNTLNLITTITAGVDEAVVLPAVAAGGVTEIKNNHATAKLFIFPPSGNTINGGAADASIWISPGATIKLITSDGTNWFGEPDFEQWTFTGGLEFGGASVGMVIVDPICHYIKRGKQVDVFFKIQLSAKGTSTGAAYFTGLPYVASADEQKGTGSVVGDYVAMSSIQDAPVIHVSHGNITAHLHEKSGAATTADLTHSNFTDTSMITGSFTYLVD